MNRTISRVEQMNGYLRSIMDIMRRDKAKGPLEYIPELTWMLFVRLLDEKESRQAQESAITGEAFEESIAYPFRWRDYAFEDVPGVIAVDVRDPKTKTSVFEAAGILADAVAECTFDRSVLLDAEASKAYLRPDFRNTPAYARHSKAFDAVAACGIVRTVAAFGKKRQELQAANIDVITFVNTELIPALKGYKDNPKATVRQKIVAQIFDHIEKTRMSAERNLLDVFEKVHRISDSNLSGENFFAMSQIYEGLLLKMGDKNSDGGQFFTPRSVIKAMIHAVSPKTDATFYDPCCGTGGFLAETYKYLYENRKPNSIELQKLSNDAFWGMDNSDAVFPITIANLAVHGIDLPHIANQNTITGQITYDGLFQGAPNQFDYVFTNPPFGGKENVELIKGTSFAYKTSNTQILFVQHVIEKLKTGGECAIVLDEGVLFRTNETAFVKTKAKLLDECDLHTVVSLPGGVFTSTGAWVKTNLLFFKKGAKTREVWYYDMSDIKVNKGHPLTFGQFEEFLRLYRETDRSKKVTDKSWFVSREDIEAKGYDLKAVNPNVKTEEIRDPKIIAAEIIEGLERMKGWMEEVKRSL